MTFNAKQNLDAFGRALGNEKRTLGVVAEAMSNVRNNDASQLAKMLEMARRRKDDRAVAAIRFLINKVWKGAKIETPEKKPVIVKIKGAEFKAEALALIVKAGEDELALRGPAIKKRFKEFEAEPAPEAGAEPEAEAGAEAEPEAEAEDETEFDAMALVLGLTPEQREAVAKALVDIAAAEELVETA